MLVRDGQLRVDEKSERIDGNSERLDEKSERVDEKSERIDEKSERMAADSALVRQNSVPLEVRPLRVRQMCARCDQVSLRLGRERRGVSGAKVRCCAPWHVAG